MKLKTLVLAIGLAVAAVGSIGSANAALQIVGDAAGNGPLDANKEAIGDPGGTLYSHPATSGASAGVGMPTALGGWPAGAGFAVDMGPAPGAGNMGISGWDGSYLNLTQAANVTFQFTGRGDAADNNIFQINVGSGWTTIWDNQSSTNGTCGTSGTSLSCPFAGSQQTFFFNAGLIDFRFMNLNPNHPATATNDGTNNPKEVAAGFFLGADPYLASGPYSCGGPNASCNAVYAGFTDQGGGDHDYEDLGLRISVPEPGTMFLLGSGLMGFAAMRRRKS